MQIENVPVNVLVLIGQWAFDFVTRNVLLEDAASDAPQVRINQLLPIPATDPIWKDDAVANAHHRAGVSIRNGATTFDILK